MEGSELNYSSSSIEINCSLPDDDSNYQLEHIDITSNVPENYSCFHSGASSFIFADDLDGMMQYVDQGNPIGANEDTGNTPLHTAVVLNRTSIVNYLVGLRNIGINARNFHGETALLISVEMKNKEFVKTLLEHGADVNISNSENQSPIHLATTLEDFTWLLLEHNAKFNVTDTNGWTPFTYAVAENNLTAINILLSKGADINLGKVTPFMMALIDKNALLQGLLVDFVNFQLHPTRYLTLSITGESPHIEKVVKGCALVSFFYFFDAAINSSLALTLFQIICKTVYQRKRSRSSRLNNLIEISLSDYKIMNYFSAIAAYNQIDNILEEYDNFSEFNQFLLNYLKREFPTNFLIIIVSMLLTNDLPLRSNELYIFYHHYKSRELLYIMLRAEIRLNYTLNESNEVLRVWFEVEVPMPELNNLLSSGAGELFSVFHEPSRVARLLESAPRSAFPRKPNFQKHTVRTCSQCMTMVVLFDAGVLFKKTLIFRQDIYIPWLTQIV